MSKKYDESWKSLNLIAECRKFKLPYSGRKVELIKRLNDHFKVQDDVNVGVEGETPSEETQKLEEFGDVVIDCFEEEINDEVEEEEDTIGNEHGSEGKSLKRKRNVYMFSQKFDSYSDSIKHLKSDFVNNWCNIRRVETKNGIKEY